MPATLTFGIVVYDAIPALAFPSYLGLAKAAPGAPWLYEVATSVAIGRNRIVAKFLEGEDDILVFLDSDMQFDPVQAQRIVEKLEKNPDLGALAAYYIKRDGSGLPVCNWKNGSGWIKDEGRVLRAARHLKAGELAYVDSFGGGLLATSRTALKQISEPWFVETQDPPEGNDTYFCRRLQEAGFHPSVDFGTRIGHVGQGVFREGLAEKEM